MPRDTCRSGTARRRRARTAASPTTPRPAPPCTARYPGPPTSPAGAAHSTVQADEGVTVTPAPHDPDLRSASDLLGLDDEFTESELAVRETVRAFVGRRIRPHIAEWFDTATFPLDLVPELADLGLLAMQELEAGDSGIRTFVSVQGSLAMTAIHRHGSPEQREEWLPRMARGEVIGCFGLTEPTAGSDPASMA